jgi:hypothetical protein
VGYRYAILIEVSDPLSAEQGEQLAAAVDEVVMRDLPNFLAPFGYEGYQDGASAIVSAPEGESR